MTDDLVFKQHLGDLDLEDYPAECESNNSEEETHNSSNNDGNGTTPFIDPDKPLLAMTEVTTTQEKERI